MLQPNARGIIWFPIIHTQADLGSMSATVRELHIQRTGPRKWTQHVRTVEELWRNIRLAVAQMDLVYERVRLYQDGLPECGKEERIVRDLAQAGSLNHQLLLELMARGAQLTGTESAEMLIEEYNLARQALVQGKRQRAHQARLQELSLQLLARRDRFIADRIARTLEPGATGLVFLGLMHSLKGLVPADIQVTRWENPCSPTIPEPTEEKKEPQG